MSDEKDRREDELHADNEHHHRLAVGLLTGAAVGVGMGMLFAPRKGSELREEVKTRSNDAYATCKDTLARGATETRRYVREVSDAVTMKARRQADSHGSTRTPEAQGPGRGPTAY